jgi:hypothetical protein
VTSTIPDESAEKVARELHTRLSSSSVEAWSVTVSRGFKPRIPMLNSSSMNAVAGEVSMRALLVAATLAVEGVVKALIYNTFTHRTVLPLE